MKAKNKRQLLFTFVALLILAIPLGVAFAQADYYFSAISEQVDVFWEADGTLTLEYNIIFLNGDNSHEIDVVDLGLPNANYTPNNITATLHGRPASFIEWQSDYIETGPALWFSDHPVPPGQTAAFFARVTDISGVLYTDNEDETLASAVFIPNYFGSEFVFGATFITVVYHLPPGVQPDEPKWHTADHPGFPDTPQTGRDDEGRITYTWHNPDGSIAREYLFGASFPKKYVPAGAIQEPNFWQRYNIDPEFLIPFVVCICFALFIIALVWIGVVSDRRRRMQYLPPKIAIEGNGIKRGLTAPEAAILLEQPMDKILTMILFSTIRKGAAQVAQQEPLEVAVTSPAPKDLREYESQFLAAFKEGDPGARRRAMQTLMVDIVKGVANKMRGFSKRETVDYYRTITEDAWKQVEDAKTPKVQSKLYEENLEWTMMDEDYDDRTRRTFTGRTVYAPYWWGRYAGSGGRSVISAPSRSTGGSRVSLPTLPGADFAASVTKGVQNVAAGVTGNLADFTGGVTKTTNPPPPPTRSSGGGFSGGGSSCACACAGCACACAGGGR